MEGENKSEMEEFHRLIRKIREEAVSLQEAIISDREREEINQIEDGFDREIQAQVYSTLNNLLRYQVDGWRELVDGGDHIDDGAGSAQGEK